MKRLLRVTVLASCVGFSAHTAMAEMPDFSGTQLNMTGFGGILEEGEIKAWAEPFAAATGATVNITNPVSYARIKAQVTAGHVIEDLAHTDAFFVQANCGTLFEKIDTSKLIGLGIRPEYITNDCGLPTTAGSMLFAYNTDTFNATPPKSWADFFDTKNFPGRRGVWNFVQNGVLEAALLADGVPPDQLYPLDLDRAFAKLDTIKSDILWVQSPGAMTEAMVSEEVDLAVSFSARAYAAVRDGAPIAQVHAQQLQFWDNVAIVKGTKNFDAAKAFIEFGAKPEVLDRYFEITTYGSTNMNSNAKIDELIASYMPLNPETVQTAVFLNQDWWAENFDMVNQRFVDWQSK